MRIHRLEIEGFGPFRDTQVVDFDAVAQDGIFLIGGKTGAGKSSILDAVCFALYGGVPRYEDGEKRLRSDHSSLDELLADPSLDAHHDDWVCAVLTDPTPQIDPMRKLQTRFAWCATIKLDPVGVPAASRITYADRVRDVESDDELIERFLTHVRAGEGAGERERELIADAVAEARVAELTS